MTKRQVSSRPSSIAEPPQVVRLVEARRLDLAVELHVLAQVELVGDEIEIAKVLRLAGKPFLPVPLVEQFLRERIAVGVALGVEPGSRIAVPVPGAAEVGRGVEHQGVDAEVGQPLDLIDSGHTRANDDDFVVRLACLRHSLLRYFVLGLRRLERLVFHYTNRPGFARRSDASEDCRPSRPSTSPCRFTRRGRWQVLTGVQSASDQAHGVGDIAGLQQFPVLRLRQSRSSACPSRFSRALHHEFGQRIE